ncbi:MAG TPA: contractile injection system protein, VgrG/Pvc8 family [Sorangium sp.]|nr:contractile injection system protein, VgrG/Pvc8 family [Sorangium sp.]
MVHSPDRLVLSALSELKEEPFLLGCDHLEDGNPLFRIDARFAVPGETRLDARKLLNSEATVVRTSGGAEKPVHGVITDVAEHKDARYNDVVFHVTIRPRIWRMKTRPPMPLSGAPRDLSVQEILSQKLKAHGFSEDDDFVFRLRRRSKPRRTESLAESSNDLDYLVQLCDRAGLQLSFEHHERDCLIISDRA